MIRSNVVGDVDTFRLVMIAHSREGDMAGVASILKRMWNVDIADPDFTSKPVRQIYRSAPLYPDEELLATLAHIFGTNNQMAMALALVNHFSEGYGIPVSEAVWGELFQRAFVLASPRRGKAKYSGNAVGHIPLASLERIFDTMTSPPYNVRPTFQQLEMLFTTYRHRRLLSKMLETMNRGAEHLDAQRLVLQAAEMSLRLAEREQRLRGNSWADATVKQQRAEFERQLFVERYCSSKVQRWVYHVIHRTQDLTDTRSSGWAWRGLPLFLEAWRRRCPEVIQYSIPTGHVTMLLQRPLVDEPRLAEKREKKRRMAAVVATSMVETGSLRRLRRVDFLKLLSNRPQRLREQLISSYRRNRERDMPNRLKRQFAIGNGAPSSKAAGKGPGGPTQITRRVAG